MIQAQVRHQPISSLGFTALRRMRVPSAAGFRLDVRETGARRRIGDADEMLAGRALDLTSGVARVARKRLIAVRTVEFKFGRVHKLSLGWKNHVYHGRIGGGKYMKKLNALNRTGAQPYRADHPTGAATERKTHRDVTPTGFSSSLLHWQPRLDTSRFTANLSRSDKPEFCAKTQ
jgi:hypothetical protein